MTFEELLALGGAWAWANYGKDVVKAIGKELVGQAGGQAKRALGSGWDRVEWNVAAERYQKKILELHGTTRVLGKADPIPLDGLFTDVFILDRPTAHRRFDISHLQREPELLEQNKRQSGLSLVKNPSSRRLFILGKPGSGKTTFLKYVTLQAATGALDKIPIFISLERWSNAAWEKSSTGLMGFICTQFEICDFPDAEQFVIHVLKKGNVVVMFDGLDEVREGGGMRNEMVASIRDFCSQYSQVQYLITCRIAAVEYEFETFNYVELADFSEVQINSFVAKWFAQEPDNLRLFKESFERPEFRGLRELAKTPLLLAMLCLSFGETMRFPHRRGELYEEAVDALLKKWDASRSIYRDEIYRGLSLGRKRQMLTRIAAQSFQMNKYFLPQKQLAKSITSYLQLLPGAEMADVDDGEVVLKAIEAQHGILVERAHRIYSFSHLTIQEYFSAKYISDKATPTMLRQLLHPRYISDPRWREVILMTAGMLENADEFFTIFEQTLSQLLEGEQALIRFFSRTGRQDSDSLKGILYCCITLASGYPAGWHNNAQKYLENKTAQVMTRLELDFPLPEFEIMILDYSARQDISNFYAIETLNFGPHVSSSRELSRDLDVNLIYSVALAESMKNHVSGSSYIKEINGKVITYFAEVLKLIESEVGGELASSWRNIMSSIQAIAGYEWHDIRVSIQELIKTHRPIGAAWGLSEDAMERKVKNYLYSKELLIECLRHAAVTNRKDLEARYS